VHAHPHVAISSAPLVEKLLENNGAKDRKMARKPPGVAYRVVWPDGGKRMRPARLVSGCFAG
jgi:hypothetical protein